MDIKVCCRSLLQEITELKKHPEDNDIDVALISETRLGNKVVNLPNYNCYRAERDNGGVTKL